MANSSQEPWALAPFSGTKIPNPSLRGAQQRSSLIEPKPHSTKAPSSVVTIILGFTKRRSLLMIDRRRETAAETSGCYRIQKTRLTKGFPRFRVKRILYPTLWLNDKCMSTYSLFTSLRFKISERFLFDLRSSFW